MIHMTPDRVLLPIAVIYECADVISDDFIELSLPVLELGLCLLLHPVREVTHPDVALVQGVPPDESCYFLICLWCW